MANRRVIVSYGRTMQSAPYESLRLDVSFEKDISDEQNAIEQIDKAVDGLVKYVKNKTANILENE